MDLQAIAENSLPVGLPGTGPTAEAAGDLARLQKQEALATANGFALQAPLYALGTRVRSDGADRLREIQAEARELPRLGDVAAALQQRIATEDRRATTVQLADLGLDETGRLRRVSRGPSVPGAAITETALSHLLAYASGAPAHAGSYLRSVTPDWRSDEWSRIRSGSEGRLIVLHSHRRPNGECVVHAVTSERYGTYTAADAARDLTVALQDRVNDIGAAVTYSGPDRCTIHLRSVTGIAPVRACAGEVFEAGLKISLSDTKMSGVRITSELLRNLCLNLICIGQSFGVNESVRHSGSVADRVAVILAKGWGQIQPFADLWSNGREHDLGFYGIDALSVLSSITGADWDQKALQARRAKNPWRTNGIEALPLAVPGMEGPELLGELLRAYQIEEENTVTGVANAVSRLSAAIPTRDPETWNAQISGATMAILEGGAPYSRRCPPRARLLRTSLI